MLTLFGISDPYIWLAYVLSIGFTIVCILYGLLSGRNGMKRRDSSD